MARKKATVLAIRSLCALDKVCSPNGSFHPLKTLVLLSNFNTWAAEERMDFHSSDGYCNSETPLNSQQNPGDFGVSGDTSVNHRIQSAQNGYYPEAENGVYGAENPRRFDVQSQGGVDIKWGLSNSNDGYVGRGSSGHLVGTAAHGAGSSWQSGSHPPNSYDSFGQGGPRNQQNLGWASTSNPYSTQIPGNYNIQSTGMYQRPGNTNPTLPNAVHQQGGSGNWGNASGYGGNSGQFEPISDNHFAGYDNKYSQSSRSGSYDKWNDRIHQQSPECPNTGSTMPKQIYGDYQTGSYGYHQTGGNHYAGNMGISQHSANVFQPANYDQNVTVAAQGSVNVMPEGESSSINSPKGTLEELDALCKEGKVKEAVEVLGLLEKQGISVDLPRYISLMKICKDEDALQEAKSIHEHLIKSISPVRVSTYNKILQMYARCASMDDAYTVFSKMSERNLTSWDTMISSYARNGLGEEAIDMFTSFKEAGLKPDGQMFIGVFNACAVVGDVNEGMLHFESMSKVYGITPTMKHYVSIVEMLGTTGHLDEALEFIEQMPVEPSVDVWETLMNLSRVQGNLELGDRCAEIVEQLDPSRSTKEIKAGLVPVRASDLSKEKEKKKSGQTSLELRSKIHEYRAGDRSHPENDKIYALLRGIKEQMKEAGYVPDCRFVLHDIDQEGKEEALMAHSERLATAYGLITSSVRSPIRVIKNLRVCVDCHNALKIVSKLVGRELIMRDAKRFHHMKDGKCSCNDYW